MITDVTSVGMLNQLQNQTEEAWSRLNAIYQPLIRKWLRQYGVGAADADDVSQDVLMVVCRRLDGFQRERQATFRCWLRSITVNCLRDHRRKSSRLVAGEGVRQLLQGLEDPESNLARRWDVEHDMHVLQHVLSEVKGQFQKQTWSAFQQTALFGRRPCDVAKALGMTENAVHIAKSRVRSRIRQAAKGLL